MATSKQAEGRDVGNVWAQYLLLLMLLGYWLFAYILERVDLSLPPNWLFTQLATLPLPEWISQSIYMFGGLFAPRVLRHFIPILIGWWFAYQLVIDVVQMLYELPDRQTAQQTVRRLQYRHLPHVPALQLKQEDFAQQKETAPLLKVGGPGTVAVSAGNAIVTELNGRFQRVLGSGKHSLIRFERVVALLDLRLQERSQTDIKLTTRDGIELETSLTITFRIKRGDEPVTKSNPFPVDAEAVRQAAYTQTALAGGQVSDWQAYALTTAVSKLRDFVAAQLLDELFNLRQNPEFDIYEALHRHIKSEANAVLTKQGVILEMVRVSSLEVTDSAVTEQRIRYWQSLRANARLLKLADDEAEVVSLVQIARTEAEATMIEAIIEAIQRARREGRSASNREIIALRLVESLERLTRQNEEVVVPNDSVLQQLQSLTRHLAPEPGTGSAILTTNDSR
jgi:hypothetical protein